MLAIKAMGLTKTFRLQERKANTIVDILSNLGFGSKSKNVVALDDLSFEIEKGEVFGIVGANGSGKSTLLNLLLGAMRPDNKDQLQVWGSVLRLSLNLGFDENLTTRENIYVNGSILGLTFKEIGGLFWQILDFADLRSYVDMPVKYFSNGMKSRLMFSVAIHAKADIYLLDEFLTGVGDKDFTKKSEVLLRQKLDSDKTIVLVSHTMEDILKYCSRCMWLDKGQIRAVGTTNEVVAMYLNELT